MAYVLGKARKGSRIADERSVLFGHCVSLCKRQNGKGFLSNSLVSMVPEQLDVHSS